MELGFFLRGRPPKANRVGTGCPDVRDPGTATATRLAFRGAHNSFRHALETVTEVRPTILQECECSILRPCVEQGRQ